MVLVLIFTFISLFGLQMWIFRSPLTITWFISIFVFAFLIFFKLSTLSNFFSLALPILCLGGMSFIRTIKFDKWWSLLNMSLGVFIIYILNDMLFNYKNVLPLNFDIYVSIGFIMIGWHILIFQYERPYESVPSSKKLFNHKYPVYKRIYIFLLIFVSSFLLFLLRNIPKAVFKMSFYYLLIWLTGFYLQKKIQTRFIPFNLLWALALSSIFYLLKAKGFVLIRTYVGTINLVCLGTVIKNLFMLPPVYAPIKKDL